VTPAGYSRPFAQIDPDHVSWESVGDTRGAELGDADDNDATKCVGHRPTPSEEGSLSGLPVRSRAQNPPVVRPCISLPTTSV
jgi:hypothetical protein